MKVIVATPVYDGKLPIETVRCLLAEQAVALGGGFDLQFRFLPACSHPAMGRNQLAQDFMDSGADKLVFLDSDVTFEPGAILKLASRSEDFVGGAYRFKIPAESYPVGWLSADLWATQTGLLEVETLPGGFLCLSRKVFETLKAAHPERAYAHMGRVAHGYFQMPFVDGNLYGEDTYFCKEWRDTGGKVFLDPELQLTHWDFNQPYPGHIGKWLKSRMTPKEGAA
jgi:hypothetical protein